MSEPATLRRASDDKTLPVVIYVLYLVGLVNGLTTLIGFIIAYTQKGRASEMARSHYVFQIRTVFIGLAAILAGVVIFLLGILLVIVLIGFPLIHLAQGIWALTGLWFLVRSVVGLIFAARGEPYPRPQAWLI